MMTAIELAMKWKSAWQLARVTDGDIPLVYQSLPVSYGFHRVHHLDGSIEIKRKTRPDAMLGLDDHWATCRVAPEVSFSFYDTYEAPVDCEETYHGDYWNPPEYEWDMEERECIVTLGIWFTHTGLELATVAYDTEKLYHCYESRVEPICAYMSARDFVLHICEEMGRAPRCLEEYLCESF